MDPRSQNTDGTSNVPGCLRPARQTTQLSPAPGTEPQILERPAVPGHLSPGWDDEGNRSFGLVILVEINLAA